MIRLFPTYTTKKQLSLKKFLLVFFICAAIAPWIGISTIQADEDETDPGEYTENNEVNFQNDAQRRHAKNLAIKMALQDDNLMDKVSEAKNNDDYDTARDLFKSAVDENMEEISKMRAEGYGWGYIAQHYKVHPKYLGLGHYKNRAKHPGLNDSSQKEARGLALGHSKDKDGRYGVAQDGGNGHGNGVGNGNGNGVGNAGGGRGGKK
jgi:hypothetical protein